MSTYTHLLLDLDDTLYPHTSGVWLAVSQRIQMYIQQRLKINQDQAVELRSRYLTQFGTTLSGLKHEYGVDTQEYLDFVHDIPVEIMLHPDPNLIDMLQSIKLPRIIFTNAYRPYVDRVLASLDISEEIDQVIDIYALEFQNKPRPEAYDRALKLISADDPARIVFVDDRRANLDPAAKLKIKTVLVGPDQDGHPHLHIGHITDLTEVIPELCQSASESAEDG